MSGDKQMKKRKLRKGAVVVISVLLVAIVGLFLYLFLFFNFKFIGVNSIHADALKYQEKHCLVFYPDGDNPGLELAKKMCKEGEEDTIYDYALKPYGDYKLVDYGQGDKYFIDQNNKELVITIDDINDNAKKIISDYLRYEAKKQKRDEAYSITFLEKTHVSNLDLSNAAFDVEGENLLVDIPEFDIEVAVPLKYMQTELGKNFGYTNELYVKPRYVDPDRPMIAMTFDDGPRSGTTDIILNILKEENVKATFFVTNSGPDDLIKRAYDEGHAVGLHTASHDYSVVYASGDSYFNDLKLVSERVKRITGEESKLIRFPGGSSNTISRKYSPGIMSYLTQEVVKRGYRYYDWNIDSRDAEGGRFNADEITKFVTSKLSHDKVNMVLMHDIKVTTMEALRNIIRYGKENGYVFDKIGPYTDMVMQHVNN